MFRPFKLRFRRRVKKSQRQVEGLSYQAEQTIDRHLLRRFDRLLLVRRFVVAWVGLFVLLIGCSIWQLAHLSAYYQSLQPVAGGIYSEGLQGTFTNANPLFASSPVDSTVSRLVFAGLFKYDEHNKLVGDLAKDYVADEKGTTYTVHLRPNLTWQDGKPLTSADVVFTYQAIQNPDTGSPLVGSWQGINMRATDEHTVVFTLPNVLASFPYNMTTGIIPKHILGKVPATDLRSQDFNTQKPVGAGPFSWLAVQLNGSGPNDAQEQIGLVPFERYVGGAPKLKEFIVHAYASRDQLIKDFKDRQLNAAAGLESTPEEFKGDPAVEKHNYLLTAGTYVFFKTSTGLFSDVKVRQALVRAADPAAIMALLNYPTRRVSGPLLQGQLAYDKSIVQATGKLAEAKSLLDQAGWKEGANGMRSKNGQQLTFTLTAADNTENQKVAVELQRQWKAAGINANIDLQAPDLFNGSVKNHDYEALLNGITIGVDPDVFVYWDSSQANPLSAYLNLSEYKSTVADSALESGRTRLDPKLRVLKYKPFLQAWQNDAPALGLYQPRFLYFTHDRIYGVKDHALNSEADRFSNVQNWMIRTAKVTN
jgi:peptide/nickel transport system substrate-binding protein